jgi:collagenase-like PrtC family protease
MTAGINHFRIEFVDEKAEDVVKIVNMYQDVCKNIQISESFDRAEHDSSSSNSKSRSSSSHSDDDYDDSQYSNSNSNGSSNNNSNSNSRSIAERNIESTLNALWRFLEVVPNGHGLPQGVSLGSLKPTLERNWDTLRPTAKR